MTDNTKLPLSKIKVRLSVSDGKAKMIIEHEKLKDGFIDVKTFDGYFEFQGDYVSLPERVASVIEKKSEARRHKITRTPLGFANADFKVQVYRACVSKYQVRVEAMSYSSEWDKLIRVRFLTLVR